MLEILKKREEEKRKYENECAKKFNGKSPDIIVCAKEEKRIYNKDGSITIKFEEKKTNITRKVNETQKIIKEVNAEEKIAELKKIIEKEINE